MTTLIKILLTIPSIVGIAYMLTFWNDDFFEGNKESSKIIYASKAITWLK